MAPQSPDEPRRRVTNLVPGQYREVSVTDVDVPLTRQNLERHFIGREVYRRTRFAVVRHRADTAVISVSKTQDDRLMSVVTGIDLLAGSDECQFLTLPDIDTAVPTSLASAARGQGGDARCVVVEGRYHHISFILDPSPLRIRVTEVVPPGPPKLVDQAQRVLAVAEDLPPIELVPDLVDLADLAARHPAPRYLFPCRGSGAGVDGAEVCFLDERPPREEWTLIGCARSRSLHQWFYGDLPATVELCPRLRPLVPGTVTLTKCCLLEDHNEVDGTGVVVPWGASLELVRQALATLARAPGTETCRPG